MAIKPKMTKKTGRKKWETVLTLLFAVLSLSGSYYYAGVRQKVQVQHIADLKNQLSIIRTGVLLYRVTHHNNPASLQELFSKTFNWGDGERRFVDLSIQQGEKFLDPFGNAYYYDGKSGWVRSATTGYEFW